MDTVDRNLAVAVRRGWFAPAVLLAFAAFGWAQPADVGAETSDGERSAETAPAGGVEDADEAEAEPADQPEEEAPEPEPKEDSPQDVFVPTENLSEDISVPFPVDI